MIGGCLSKPSPSAARDMSVLLGPTALSAPVNVPLRGITPRKTRSTLLETKSDVVRTSHAKTESSSTPMGTCCAVRDCTVAKTESLAKSAAASISARTITANANEATSASREIGSAESAEMNTVGGGIPSISNQSARSLLSITTISKLKGSIPTILSAYVDGVSTTLCVFESIVGHLQTVVAFANLERLVRIPKLSGKRFSASNVVDVPRVARSAGSQRITSSPFRAAGTTLLSTSKGFASRAIPASLQAWLRAYSTPSSTASAWSI